MSKDDFISLLQEKQADDIENSGKLKVFAHDKIDRTHNVMSKEQAQIKQAAAVREDNHDDFQASSGFVPLVGPNDVIEYKQSGVQPYMLRKLRLGEYKEIEHIDLHGKTIEQAYDLVMAFLKHAIAYEYRCIMIVHGKGSLHKAGGERSQPKSLLKSYVAYWLRQIPEVLAYHSAPEFKGGTGSVMIILKKGLKSSALNREMHAKR